MAKLSDVYTADQDAAEKGTWLTLRPGTKDDKPLRVQIRSAHSRLVRKEEQKLDRKYRVQYMAGNGQLDPETADEREVVLIAKAVLVSWENFQDDGGKALAFTHKVVTETLTAYPQLRREIMFLARSDDNFRPERIEAEREGLAGN